MVERSNIDITSRNSPSPLANHPPFVSYFVSVSSFTCFEISGIKVAENVLSYMYRVLM